MSCKGFKMNANQTPNKREQHADIIARALVNQKPVNAVEAGIQYGIWRLSSIIHRLRRKGWPIISERDSHNGLAHYSLPPHWKSNTHDDLTD